MAHAARAFAGPIAPRSSPRLRARRGCLVRAAAADAAVGANADFGPDNRLRFAPPSSTPKTAPPGAPPIVILPGFGNNTKDYVNPFGDPDVSLVASLRARGWDVHVVDLERKDWAKILRAVFSLGFWRGDGTTEPGYTWYLERVDATVRAALAANPGATAVDLVAHSAGGWLARAYIGGALNEVRWDRFRYVARDPEPAPPPKYAVPHPNVRRLVTLGTPQRVASGPDANDATRGALRWVDERWPGATFAEDGVRYACVTGRTVRGVAGKDAKGTLPGYSCNSYVQVCGEGDGVVGDAVVPNDFALLDGAAANVLDGVFHSMSKVGTYDEDSGEVWYGSESVVDAWLGELL